MVAQLRQIALSLRLPLDMIFLLGSDLVKMKNLFLLFVIYFAAGTMKMIHGCNKLADDKDPRTFHTIVHGKHLSMICAQGTVFNQEKCDCDYFTSPQRPKKCHKKPDFQKNTVFTVNVHGEETKMECAPGTVYIPDLCDCGYLDPPVKTKVCNKKADPLNKALYSVMVDGINQKMVCAPGTIYNAKKCKCVYLIPPQIRRRI